MVDVYPIGIPINHKRTGCQTEGVGSEWCKLFWHTTVQGSLLSLSGFRIQTCIRWLHNLGATHRLLPPSLNLPLALDGLWAFRDQWSFGGLESGVAWWVVSSATVFMFLTIMILICMSA